MWPNCIFYITVLLYCCVMTVCNTLYKKQWLINSSPIFAGTQVLLHRFYSRHYGYFLCSFSLLNLSWKPANHIHIFILCLPNFVLNIFSCPGQWRSVHSTRCEMVDIECRTVIVRCWNVCNSVVLHKTELCWLGYLMLFENKITYLKTHIQGRI